LGLKVKLLGQSLGQVIRAGASGEKTFATVEEMRGLAKAWRADGDAAHFDALVGLAKGLSSECIRETARAFTHFLALANDAETHHRMRRVRARDQSEGGNAGPPKQSTLNSVLGTVQALLKGGGEHPTATPEAIYDALCTQTVDIILTAHPTEVNRRSILLKHRIIDESLEALDRSDLLWFERQALEARIDRQVNSLWWTDEIRRTKPTPQKEAQQGLDIVESSLWKSVPAFLRRIDAELVATPQIGKPLPPDAAPVKFGSWMGGDRDGNPNVTAAVTKEVVIMSRLRAAALIRESLTDLRRLITVSVATPELWASLPPHAQGKPYQLLIDQLLARLDATTAMLHAGDLAPRTDAATSEAGKPAPLVQTSELKGALLAMHASLCGVGLTGLADGDLRDLIRQVSTFGLSLLPLDVRQESTRHSEALDAVTNYLGVGSYLEWGEAQRTDWLLKELLEPRPLLPRRPGTAYADLGDMFTASVCDVLETFDMVAAIPADGLSAYVISMAKTASDVLAVRLLQKEAGVAKPMRVVPLFETLADLENAESVMEALWSLPWYKHDTGGKTEVMLGYSDSAKDVKVELLTACLAKHK
jgi:phosphoenolpyruvate carboxylase